MKNKIGILTFHTGFNYGASLQAYALQTVITSMGLESEIINFETERFVASREMFSRNPTRIKEIIKMVSRLPYRKSLQIRQNMFEDFTKKHLKISPLYRTEAEVIAHANDYDCIVCGSDQIWNMGKTDKPAANMLFFLNFPKSQRRVSYAASFGEWVSDAPNLEGEFVPWLKQFDAISIREISGVKYLRSIGIDCELTLDPTVLLEASDYDPICAERLIKGKYVLMFSWNCNSDIISAAKKVSAELSLPLIHITPPPRAMIKRVRRKLDVGPKEFLSLIKYSEFILTNSFHGTVFSIMFEKPFTSIVSGKADPRMESLLIQLGLVDHLVSVDQIDIKKMQQTDFVSVRNKKNNLRKSSFEFLKYALDK